jgi:thiamine kinase-like enzyme
LFAEALLSETESATTPALPSLLQTLVRDAGTSGRPAAGEELKPGVYRLRFAAAGETQSVIAKRLEPGRARRNQLVAQRWLPAVGLSGCVPSLLGIAAEPSGAAVWHVYEDLGDNTLEAKAADPGPIAAAVKLIADLHMRFAEHRLLAECRFYGDDFGAGFFGANVRDAIRSLESLRPPAIRMGSNDAALRDRLLRRLHNLLDEEPLRAHSLAELGGPETLLHGDLWTTNAILVPNGDGVEARLIDWDHVGVGPVTYDLSTFLARFPAGERHWILNLYRRQIRRCGWQMPEAEVLNSLFDTAEYARLANRVIWPALAAWDGEAEWAFRELAEVEQWLDELRQILP